jgi:ABC-type amino acid transport substrate-binding protein
MRHALSKMIRFYQKNVLNSTVLRIAVAVVCLAMLSPIASAESLYDRVLRTGKIRAGYMEWYPFLNKNPNTKKVNGIGFDTLDLAMKRLGLKLELTEEVTWGTMIEGLRTNRYDILACPVWANSTRARVADFSRPICYSPVCAFTRYGDKRLDSSLKGVAEGKYKIATTDGEMAEIIAKTDFPKAPRLSLPQLAPISDLMLSVATGKADMTFTEPPFAAEFVKHNPKSIQNITPNNPLRVFPTVYMFKAGETEFRAMLNTALDEIANSGELGKILDKYEPYPKAYLRCASPYQK